MQAFYDCFGMFFFLVSIVFYHKNAHSRGQTIQNRHKTLLQKAQEELEGNGSNKLSLKATLTDQIKEQENTLATVKEVMKNGRDLSRSLSLSPFRSFSPCFCLSFVFSSGFPLTHFNRLTGTQSLSNRTLYYVNPKQIPKFTYTYLHYSAEP